MKKITVCGSLKFKQEMMEIAFKMECMGNCMIIPIFPNNIEKESISKEEIETLGIMHKEKIKLSDAILVININGYIGSSTKEEIEYAGTLGKEIIYYEDIKNVLK